MSKSHYKSCGPIDTKRLGMKIASQLNGGEVICLYGDLGAGKTTFVNGMVNYYLPETRVLSPTFIIVRHYLINHNNLRHFLHVDLYRLKNLPEIESLGLEDYLHKSDTIMAIEWPEKMRKLLPKKRIDIKFQILSDNQRILWLTNYE